MYDGSRSCKHTRTRAIDRDEYRDSRAHLRKRGRRTRDDRNNKELTVRRCVWSTSRRKSEIAVKGRTTDNGTHIMHISAAAAGLTRPSVRIHGSAANSRREISSYTARSADSSAGRHAGVFFSYFFSRYSSRRCATIRDDFRRRKLTVFYTRTRRLRPTT